MLHITPISRGARGCRSELSSESSVPPPSPSSPPPLGPLPSGASLLRLLRLPPSSPLGGGSPSGSGGLSWWSRRCSGPRRRSGGGCSGGRGPLGAACRHPSRSDALVTLTPLGHWCRSPLPDPSRAPQTLLIPHHTHRCSHWRDHHHLQPSPEARPWISSAVALSASSKAGAASS